MSAWNAARGWNPLVLNGPGPAQRSGRPRSASVNQGHYITGEPKRQGGVVRHDVTYAFVPGTASLLFLPLGEERIFFPSSPFYFTQTSVGSRQISDARGGAGGDRFDSLAMTDARGGQVGIAGLSCRVAVLFLPLKKEKEFFFLSFFFSFSSSCTPVPWPWHQKAVPQRQLGRSGFPPHAFAGAGSARE